MIENFSTISLVCGKYLAEHNDFIQLDVLSLSPTRIQIDLAFSRSSEYVRWSFFIHTRF